jgi:hypothetical protein
MEPTTMPDSYHRLAHWAANSFTYFCDQVDDAAFWERRNGLNSPGWTLGHLAVEDLLVVQRLGGRAEHALLDVEALSEFRMGSSGTVSMPLPRADLAAAYLVTVNALLDIVDTQGALLAEQPLPWEGAGPEMTRTLDDVLHLLISHPATHLGSLVAWGKAAPTPTPKQP